MSLHDMVEKLLRLSEPKQMMAEISYMGSYEHCISADQNTGVIRVITPKGAHDHYIRGEKSESDDKIITKAYRGEFIMISESKHEIKLEEIVKSQEPESAEIEYEITEKRYDRMILQQINELKISLSNKEIRAEIEKGGTPIENIQNLLERLDFAKEIAKDRYFDNMPDFRKAIVEMTQKVELLYKGKKAAKKSKKERNQKPNKLTNDNREYVKKLVKLIVSAENHEEAIRQLKNEERKFTGIGDKTLFTKSTKRLNASQMARVISDIGRFKYGEKFPDYETVRKELRYHL